MRIISNDEFIKAWETEDNQNIIEMVASNYTNSLSYNDLHRCKMIGLWNALATFDAGKAKFTTHLANHVKWECYKSIHELQKSQKIVISQAIAESGVLDEEYFGELIGDLDEESQSLLVQRFIGRCTFKEIGEKNGYSHETARKKTLRAIKILKDSENGV